MKISFEREKEIVLYVTWPLNQAEFHPQLPALPPQNWGCVSSLGKEKWKKEGNVKNGYYHIYGILEVRL